MQVAAAGLEAERHGSNRNSRKKTAVSQSCFELGLGRNDYSCWLPGKGGGIIVHVVKNGGVCVVDIAIA